MNRVRSYIVTVAVACAWTTSWALLKAQEPPPAPTALERALPADASGADIFTAACAACHGTDGKGAPQHIVGFPLPLPNGHDLPDLTDCAVNTVEPFTDWLAVVARGGPIRALDRHMPAFGDALDEAQLTKAIQYTWSFCSDRVWPRGDLNMPRAFFTEKAFPENEAVWTTTVATGAAKAVRNELLYERRIGARGQIEINLPFDLQQVGTGAWARGLGDIEVAARRTMYASLDRGQIFSAGAAVILPTGKEHLGLGNGFTVFEPFAMFGQLVGASAFVQFHTGYEIPSDAERGRREGFVRSAFGYTFAQDDGFGRTWTPMLEVLAAKPEDGPAEWDLVPQVQVSLSKLQHVLLSVGVRMPLNERQERKPQVMAYFLWDWFDGGLFQFWR